MRTLLLLAALAAGAFGADWGALSRVTAGQLTEVTTMDGQTRRGQFGLLRDEALVLRSAAGEESVPRDTVRQVKVKDEGRRVRRGLLWTAIGAGAGLGIGLAVCPGCANEGNGAKFAGPGVAAGAGLGALGFLSSDWRVVYSREKATP